MEKASSTMTNIVLLIHNRLRLTTQALTSLADHTDPDAYTLTLVDDSSTDFRVQRLCRDHIAAACFRIENSFHVLSQAKNAGVYWSEQVFGRGEYLCIADNDVYFCEGWLDRMVEAAQDSFFNGFRLWGGQAHPFHQPEATRRLPNSNRIMHTHDCLAGTHWFMQWPTWDDFGPFDRTTAAGVCQSEDYAFTQRLRAAGHRIGVTVPHCVLDCGITQTDGKPSPGAEEKMKRRVEGVYYE